MIKSKKIIFVGLNSELLKILSQDNEVELVSSISFLETISVRFFPDLIVLDGNHFDDVISIRKVERLIKVPILICTASFAQYKNLNSISSYNKVLICNEVVALSSDFIIHLKKMIDKKSSFLSAKSGNIVKYSILYMNKNISKKIIRKDIANQLGVNQDYLTRIFKQEMGINLWKYLTLCKLELARKMLLHSGLSIKEIADECGFEDLSYFDKIFFKHYKTSPSKIRNID